MMKRSLLVLALALSCVHTPEPPQPSAVPGPAPATSRPTALPPPSSIVAVLAHREDLGLNDTQVAQLLEAQQQLERQDTEAREKLACDGPATARVPAGAASAPGQGPPDQGPSGSRMGHHRGGLGGNRRSGDIQKHGPADREEALAQAVADNDTHAFLHTEPIFNKDQWERARAIAEEYRANYADRREALKGRVKEQAK
jgi:hypothetical protein